MAARKDSFLFRWLVTAVAVLAATKIVPGIESTSWPGLIITALLLGIFNAVLKPFLFLLTLPLQILTLGLFTLVINALLLMFAGALVDSFHIGGFWPAFFAALIISIISGFLNLMFGGSKEVRVHVNRGPRPNHRRSQRLDDDSKGPIIDV